MQSLWNWNRKSLSKIRLCYKEDFTNSHQLSMRSFVQKIQSWPLTSLSSYNSIKNRIYLCIKHKFGLVTVKQYLYIIKIDLKHSINITAAYASLTCIAHRTCNVQWSPMINKRTHIFEWRTNGWMDERVKSHFRTSMCLTDMGTSTVSMRGALATLDETAVQP